MIVGFPGETEEDFQESCRFVKALRFDSMNVLSYSERGNTSAAGLPGKVPEAVIAERNRILTRQDPVQRAAIACHGAIDLGTRSWAALRRIADPLLS